MGERWWGMNLSSLVNQLLEEVNLKIREEVNGKQTLETEVLEGDVH